MRGIGENEDTGEGVIQKMDKYRENIKIVNYHH